jgi:micrococcal nuclease
LALAILIVLAPLLLLLALASVVVAWARPELLGRVSSSPRLTRVPEPARATPMRFAVSATAVALALTLTSNVVAGNRSSAPATEAEQPETAVASAANSAARTTSPVPTATPTAVPTLTQTPVPTPVFGTEPTGPVDVAIVTRVVDGDTIEVRIAGRTLRVRYIGINAPGPNSWMSAEATRANATLVAGREVHLETDVSDTDQYGRLLRYIWLQRSDGWMLVNRELVALGVAQVATYPPDVKYIDNVLLPAQDEARTNALGLWGPEPTPKPTPKPTPRPTSRPKPSCHPSYVGVCLKRGIGDYDCAGGSGNGPNYIDGPFRVVGYDEFGLDRDNDGWGCE